MSEQSKNTALLTACFLVPGLVFFISCKTLSSVSETQALFYSLVFALLVGSIFLLEKNTLHWFIKIPSVVIQYLLTSTTAVIIAATVLLVISFLIPTPGTFVTTLLLSAIMAILVLGTLSPLIKSDK